MSFAVAAGVSEETIVVNGVENVATSFPNFAELANKVGLNIDD
jgi:3-phosphoshikimate 1-carboxyvinyltransferase